MLNKIFPRVRIHPLGDRKCLDTTLDGKQTETLHHAGAQLTASKARILLFINAFDKYYECLAQT